jgi:NAD(P)-dependent dehydrogenase (short-subunit alcohol dehydrogenase family)
MKNVIVITEASSGFGALAARALVKAGGSVATFKMRANGIQIRFPLSSGEAEHSRDQAELPGDFSLADPSCLSLPNHVHCLITGDRPPRAPRGSEALAGLHSSFDCVFR